MKKIVTAVVAIVISLTMIGCDDPYGDMTLTEVFEELRGEPGTDGQNGVDGQSVYELWQDQGNEGNETVFLDWLKGEVGTDGINGTDGVDGVCPECNATIDVPVEPEPDLEGSVLMTFKTGMAIDNVKIGYFKDGSIAMMSDANVTEENGLTSVVYSLDINQSGNYMMGLEFTN